MKGCTKLSIADVPIWLNGPSGLAEAKMRYNDIDSAFPQIECVTGAQYKLMFVPVPRFTTRLSGAAGIEGTLAVIGIRKVSGPVSRETIRSVSRKVPSDVGWNCTAKFTLEYGASHEPIRALLK